MWAFESALNASIVFVLVAVLIVTLDPWARRIGLLDHPQGRKDHAKPTPVIGGLAIAIGTTLPMLALTPVTQPVLGLMAAAVIILGVGIWDDLKDLPWQFRIVTQVMAALALVYVGGVRVEQIGPVFGFKPTALGAMSVPFTVMATVGLINALNMVDGLDGLAGSLVFCAFAMLTAASLYSGNEHLAMPLIMVAAGVAAFLAFNLRTPWRSRAQIFLGDSGSSYLGLVFAWAAFRLTQTPAHPVSPVLAPFLMAPPVIDCLVLLGRRLMHRRSPFSADRSHLHHLMLDGGFSVTGVVATVSAGSLAIGLTAAVVLRTKVPHPYFLAAYLVLVLGYFLFSAKHERAVAFFRLLSSKKAGLVSAPGAESRPAE